MFKVFLISLLILLSACSQKTAIPKLESQNPSKKVFDAEDTYIIFALRAEQVGDYKTAAKLFKELYEKSQKREYLYRYLKDKLILKEYSDIIQTVDDVSKASLDDAKLIRFKIMALMESNQLLKAQKLSLSLAEKTDAIIDDLLVSDIYIKAQEYDKAVKYLENAYSENYNEELLNKLAIILYVNLDKKKEAIEKLETHSRMHGCSKIICNRLIRFYSHEKNIDGLLSVYKRLYAKEKNKAVAEKIIQIYSYKREYIKLMNFLEENHINDELLLQLYLSGKDYMQASKLAYKLYEESGDYSYLGQSAIYKYESYKGSVPKAILQEVVDDLENTVKYNKETLYMNYLGYILIDHDLDVRKGLKYIQEVLKKDPNSAYYLDSLAWGYYKLGKCKKAKKIMQKVLKLGVGEEKEVQEHLKKINSCIKTGRIK